MKVDELLILIKEIIGEEFNIDEKCPLIGGNSNIDSMNLVQICLALEEKSTKENFSFDWTSEKAMSTISSVFRNAITLTDEYNRQKAEGN
tara:strand:+ start:4381 stop:4650 length:270 start_codon:yes stop_codon:yes gene_type:complete